ncbi:hypothetical protein [Gordonia sp. NPDC058843]|uniref:hypothetical protein n=1 Tax=Gordonia sp. NPDC058843 TaxID=3346648 RepID=UPI0036CF09A0
MSEHDNTADEASSADDARDSTSDGGSTVAVKESSRPDPAAEPVAASRRPFIALGAVAVVATVLAVVFGTLWATDGSDDELTSLTGKIAAEGEAERVAGDYALSVSKVDYEDIDAWRRALETGVTQQLKEKMGTAVDVVAPLLTQMQYVSTAEKLAATVAHSDGNAYVVRVFVDMDSTSRQTPDGVAATASYTITLDRGSDWTITDVGGLGAGLPGQADPAPSGGN